MEHLTQSFTVQSANPTSGTFGGLASAFNTMIDSWVPTRIKRGAFQKTLRDNKHRIKVLYQHDATLPIGIPTRMEETDRGLYVEAKISQTTTGKDCLILLKDKVITEMSIGFDPVRFEMVNETINGNTVPVRHITELQLWEFSPVTWGANRDAVVTSVHRRDGSRAANESRIADLEFQLLQSDQRRLGISSPSHASVTSHVDVRHLELELLGTVGIVPGRRR
jgi:HK97 family phage prohead protease